MKNALLFLTALALSSQANAQTVLHYWDFESVNDVAGGLTTTAIGAPDMSLHATYGEAYPGSNKSLNTVWSGLAVGGGFLSADVHNGVSATALDFGASDFSFSYWTYDAFTIDGDARGARVFDCLQATDWGLQMGTNLANDFNFRMDDDLGGSTLSNNTLLVSTPTDAWVHVAVNVDRVNAQLEVFFNGASVGTAPIANAAAGAITPSQDLEIGVINGGTIENGAQESGLDDLAFYDGLLSAADITGLANSTLTPLSFIGASGNAFCFGDGSGTACPCGNVGAAGAGCANSAGSGGVLIEGGTLSVLADDLTFGSMGLIPNQPALLFAGLNAVNGGSGILFGDGLRCAGGGVLRLGVRVPDASGVANWPAGLGVAGGWASGDTRNFQAWYRDPSGGPCASGFNLSNGIGLTFQN